MEMKYDDLKMRKILFTYKEYAHDDYDALILKDMGSEKGTIEDELYIEDEIRRLESDLIGVPNNSRPFYDFDYNDDDCVIGEDSAFLHLQEFDSVDKGVSVRFYASKEDFDNDNYFGNVIIDTRFTISAKSEKEAKVVRAILREFGIGTFGNKALEKKRKILFDMPVDDVIDKRIHCVEEETCKIIIKD